MADFQSSDQISVSVHGLSGDIVAGGNLRIDGSKTVLSLKQVIEDAGGPAECNQQLVVGQRVLNDDDIIGTSLNETSGAVYLVALELATRNGVTFQEAVKSQKAWEPFIEVPAQLLDDIICEIRPGSHWMCRICKREVRKPLSGRIQTHITGKQHFKNLWQKLGLDEQSDPLPVDVQRWDTPWTERFINSNDTRGPYLFNHITGQQRFLGQDENLTSPEPEASSTALPM